MRLEKFRKEVKKEVGEDNRNIIIAKNKIYFFLLDFDFDLELFEEVLHLLEASTNFELSSLSLFLPSSMMMLAGRLEEEFTQLESTRVCLLRRGSLLERTGL